MKDGYWLNGITGEYALIDEHARWISDPAQARRIGLPEELSARIQPRHWHDDRVPILLTAMAAGLIRVRGHEDSVTFEFTLPREQAVPAIRRFLAATGCAGELSLLRLHDLRHRVGVSCRLADLEGPLERLLERFTAITLNYPVAALEFTLEELENTLEELR